MDAERYHRLQMLLGLAGLAVTVAYLLACLTAGVGPAVARAAWTMHPARWWQVALVAVAVGAGHAILTLPLGWVRGYHLPRRYGLLHQTLRGWLGDRLKAAAVSAALGLAAVEIVYALVATTPWWWIAAAAAIVALEIAVALVLPVWLLPLFYRLTPLADQALGARLLALARRAGLGAVGVWVADQSRKSRTANAALAGLGATRRIILFDTLAVGFEPREVEAVLAHELAHHAHGDVWRGLGLQAATTVLALWVADHVLAMGARVLHLDGPADPAGLPWFALVLLGVGVVTTPLVNAASRAMERRADDFAVALTGDVDGFVAAMERLATLNLAERRPHPVKEFLFFSHPSVERRIARAVRT
ncbi:MAG: M48 family metalloprotease [Candidatus Rokuibacteriota bacterium]